MSQIVDAHVAYCAAISDLSRDKTELLERIKQLEDRIHRASMAFFRDGSDGQVASQMLQILEEEILPVPWVVTHTEVGWATPMA